MAVQEILELAGRMCGEEADQELLTPLCQAALLEVGGWLKPGISPEECAPAFDLAAAWLALAGLETGRSEGDVSSFTAGDLTIRKKEGSGARELREQAWALMAPYRRDFFCFQGVRG